MGKVSALPRKGSIHIATVFGVPLFMHDLVGKTGLDGEPCTAAWLVKEVADNPTTIVNHTELEVPVVFSDAAFLGGDEQLVVSVTMPSLSLAPQFFSSSQESVVLTRPSIEAQVREKKLVPKPFFKHQLPAAQSSNESSVVPIANAASVRAGRAEKAAPHLLS